jgi:hypothetical protein
MEVAHGKSTCEIQLVNSPKNSQAKIRHKMTLDINQQK